MPRVPGPRTLRLAAIGTLAGLVSGALGVGGGIVMVPLLIAWLGFDPRRATATSLAAMAVIAAVAAAGHAAYGNVHLAEGVLVGVPAMAGVVAGTALQQRVAPRALAVALAFVLLAAAAALVA
jgi:uncharacterized protein